MNADLERRLRDFKAIFAAQATSSDAEEKPTEGSFLSFCRYGKTYAARQNNKHHLYFSTVLPNRFQELQRFISKV